MLRAHSAAVPSNELNSTFYGYTVERFTRWAAAVPEGFLFCPKLPRAITHDGMLEGVEEEMGAFVRATESLGAHRGLTWFALPPLLRRGAPGNLGRVPG